VRRIAAELADLGVFWLEEPLPAGDLDGMRALRRQIRVAGGEMARTPAELLAALDAGALDVLQPDVVLSVGMLRARTIAELALLRNRWFTPHTWTNGLGLLANLHVVAGVGGGPYVEFPYDPPGWTPERRDFFLAEPVRIDPDGCLTVPDRPGLGARIDHAAVARYARAT
jgi:L-alanine-DL-glutamate epimerase-like enolase superfamily enzyme